MADDGQIPTSFCTMYLPLSESSQLLVEEEQLHGIFRNPVWGRDPTAVSRGGDHSARGIHEGEISWSRTVPTQNASRRTYSETSQVRLVLLICGPNFLLVESHSIAKHFTFPEGKYHQR